MFSWDAIIDLQMRLDFFEIIRFITNYLSGSDDDKILYLKEEIEKCSTLL